MARRPIRQKIEMEGGDEIVRILRKLGERGERAFKELEDAAKKAGRNTKDFADEIDRARNRLIRMQAAAAAFARNFNSFGRSLARVGAAARTVALRVGLITAAATAAAAGIGFLVKGGLEYADEVAKTARATGLSVERFQSLGFALEQTGIDSNQFKRTMAALNQALTQYGGSSGGLKKTADAAQSNVEVYDKLGVTVTRGAKTIEDAQKKTADAAQSNVEVYDKLGVTVTRGAKTIEDAQKKTKAALDDSGESFVNVASLIEKYNIQADNSGDRLLELIDKINGVGNEQQRLGDLSILFGRRIGPDLASALSIGIAGIAKLEKQYRDTGFALTEVEAVAAEAALDSLSFLGRVINDARSRLSVLFAPAIEKGSLAFIDFLSRNRDAIEEFGKSISGAVLSAVEDLIFLLSGKQGPIENTWLLQLRDGVLVVRDAVVESFGIIRSVFNGFVASANLVAATINNIFGTDITGKGVAIAAVIGTLTGAFSVLGATLTTLFTGVIALVSGIGLLVAIFGGPLTAAVIGIAALLTRVVVQWDSLKQTFAEGWSQISAGVSAAGAAIKNAVGGAINYIVSSIAGIGSAIWEPLASGFEAIVSRLRKVWTSFVNFVSAAIRRLKSAGSSVKGDSIGGFARGGRVRGPGTPTSDSIPAFLSNMEYVINASRVRALGAGFFDFINFAPLAKLRGAFAGFQKFAGGGLAIPSPVPGFNLGGLADRLTMNVSPQLARVPFAGAMENSQLRPVNVNLGDGMIVPMQATQDAIKQLIRAGRSRSLASTFGKSSSPAWNR